MAVLVHVPVPAAQLSLVQALLSLHLGLYTQLPVAGSQPSDVQASPSLQLMYDSEQLPLLQVPFT